MDGRAERRNGAAGAGEFLELVSDLSSSLVNVGPARLDAEIDTALARVAEFFRANRCVLYKVEACQGRVGVVSIAEIGVASALPPSLDAAEEFPWLFDQIIAGHRTLLINALDELPAEAAVDRGNLSHWETAAALFIPLLAGNAVEYVLALGARLPGHAWPDAWVPRLRMLGETLVGAIRRKGLQETQSEALRFEQLIADIASRLAGAWSDQVDAQINLALQEVLAFTRNDQCGFFTVYPENGRAYLSYLAHADGVIPADRTTEYARECPWVYQRVVEKAEIVAVRRRGDLPPEAAADRSFFETRQNRSGLYIPLTVDGSVHYIFAIVSNTREQSWPERLVERLQVLGSVFANALERKSMSLALRRHERRLAESQRIAGLGSWEWDVPTGHVWTSAQTDIVLGTHVSTFADWMAMVHADERDSVRHAIEASLARPGEKFCIEFRIVRPDGAGGVFENRFEARDDDAPAPTRRVVGTIQDISSRKQREQELQDLRARQWHAERVSQTGVLVSSLAHELSQPLAAILSNAQAALRLLARDKLDDDATREILTDIVVDDKRAAQVIETLRVMLRRQRTEYRAVDAAQAVSEVLGLLHSELIAHGVEAETDLVPGCVALADKAQIHQVLINLVMNAIEAMAARQQARRRRVLLRTRTIGEDRVEFSVRDFGVGIASDQLDKIFEAFWTTKRRGIGMGLPICRSIVESHGGRIWAESGDGAGTIFTFTLPAAESRGIPGPPMPTSDTVGHLRSGKKSDGRSG